MSSNRLNLFAAACLVVGGVLGLVGSFSPPTVRSIAWGLDGTALVLGSALLAVYHLKRGHEQLAAGFLVFVAGQTLVVSGSAMELSASSPSFAAGAGLWAAALALVSTTSLMPVIVRITGIIASLMFAATALATYDGGALDPLSRPLPFFAYPFLVFTLFGWAWHHCRLDSSDTA